MKKIVLALIVVFSSVQIITAQGDGPRAHLLSPTRVWALNVKYLHLDQNLLSNGNILVKGADINVSLFPTAFVHTFGLGGKFARVFFMLNPGSLDANIASDPASLDRSLSANGFSDGFIAFEYGLIGAPALNAFEFAKHQPKFNLNAIVKYWYSGTYDSDELINLGTNRSTFEIGTTMAIPFHKDVSQNATWLEITPTMQLFTNNNDPTRPSSANVIKQDPLFIIENHLTHNFTKKLWAGVDLRYQYGGTTKADGVSDENLNNILGGGLNVGYQISAPLSIFAGYDTILAGYNDAQSNMLRVSLVFAYINLKKLKENN